MNKVSNQQGVFAIELALIIFSLCAIFMFATDLSHKLLVRAKLDRTSFALVNVLKERYRYFDGDITNKVNLAVSETELHEMQTVAARLLNTTEDQVAIQIESLVEGQFGNSFASNMYNFLGCQSDSIESESHLAPMDGSVHFPLYRVTVCEKHDSWFDPFVDGERKDFTIHSSSVMPGR
nr:tight adherence pilus pseudopilin TadF [Vibrio variabilis]